MVMYLTVTHLESTITRLCEEVGVSAEDYFVEGPRFPPAGNGDIAVFRVCAHSSLL